MSAKKKESKYDGAFATTGRTMPAKKVAKKVAKKPAAPELAEEKPRGPLEEDTAFGPEGVSGRDARRDAINNEVKLVKQGVAMQRDVARALRNKDYSGAAEIQALMKKMGFDSSIGALGSIPNVKAMRAMAERNYLQKSKKRFKLGEEAAKLERAEGGKQPAGGGGQPAGGDEDPAVGEVEEEAANLEGAEGGGQLPEGGEGQPAVGEGQPADVVEEQAVKLGYDPNPPERESQREAREATERSTESGVFGDQKKQEAFGERFGHGARDTKQKFLDDLEGSDLIKESRGLGEYDRDPNSKEVKDAQEKAYKRADELGVTREELQVKMGWETDAKAQEAAKAQAQAELEKQISYDAEYKMYPLREAASNVTELYETSKQIKSDREDQALETAIAQEETKLRIKEEAIERKRNLPNKEKHAVRNKIYHEFMDMFDEHRELPIVDMPILLKELGSVGWGTHPTEKQMADLFSDAIAKASDFDTKLGGDYGAGELGAFRHTKNVALQQQYLGNRWDAQNKLIHASLDSGRTLKGDKELMADPEFVRRLNEEINLRAREATSIYNFEAKSKFHI